MKGNFSRLRHARAKGYSRVMMQQGRVLLDSDWNEQSDLVTIAIRDLSRDIFGPHGGPGPEPGFKLTIEGSKLKIGPGRYYVQGIMVNNENRKPFYVQDQVGFSKKTLPLENEAWMAYLDVWDDYVAPEQDEALIEVALGGPDTCGRAKTFGQVNYMTLGNLTAAEYKQFEGDPTLVVNKLNENLKDSTGTMSARADAKSAPESLCVIPPNAKYSGLENQLYRVEIHIGGTPDKALYKWSRDNGAVVYPIETIAAQTFTVSTLGKDSYTAMREGMWVEYVDDALIAIDGHGILAQVISINRDDFQVTLKSADVALPFPALDKSLNPNPMLRRWDHVGDLTKNLGALEVAKADDIELEDGIKITFNRGASINYNVGDYWLIPARVAGQKIDWPIEHNTANTPALLEARGLSHVYAPLLLVAPGGGSVKDLRTACTVTTKSPP